MPHELSTARLLAQADPKKPNQSHLKRAVSAVYYSLFDALARTVAGTLVGATKQRQAAWRRVYRALDHRRARDELKKISRDPHSSSSTRRFAYEFIEAQERRHRADYDPLATFARQEVLAAISNAEVALEALATLPPDERLELASRLLFPERP